MFFFILNDGLDQTQPLFEEGRLCQMSTLSPIGSNMTFDLSDDQLDLMSLLLMSIRGLVITINILENDS